MNYVVAQNRTKETFVFMPSKLGHFSTVSSVMISGGEAGVRLRCITPKSSLVSNSDRHPQCVQDELHVCKIIKYNKLHSPEAWVHLNALTACSWGESRAQHGQALAQAFHKQAKDMCLSHSSLPHRFVWTESTGFLHILQDVHVWWNPLYYLPGHLRPLGKSCEYWHAYLGIGSNALYPQTLPDMSDNATVLQIFNLMFIKAKETRTLMYPRYQVLESWHFPLLCGFSFCGFGYPELTSIIRA